MLSATAVVKAMTSCFTSFSIFEDALDGKAGVGAEEAGGFLGDDAEIG